MVFLEVQIIWWGRGNGIKCINWKWTFNMLLRFNYYPQEQKEEYDDDVTMIIWLFIKGLCKLSASRYLLSLLLSIRTSEGITEETGLSDRGTLDGTMGTVFTLKCEWAADGGWSTEDIGWEDWWVIAERADRGCSTELAGWDGRLADIERAEDGCSTELTDTDDRPTDEECDAEGCSWTVRMF